MASIIRIKRSSGTSLPSPNLQWGELALITGISSATASGAVIQNRDRVYIGDDGGNALRIGGRYYTSMMDHAPGAIAGMQGTNSRNTDRGVIAILAPAANSGGGGESLKVDQWNVDNLRIDLNTISSTDTDGNINLDPNGIGSVRIPDDTYLVFGDGNDVSMRYDEATDDRLEVEGADWFYAPGVQLTVADTTESVTKDSGALVVEGGVGIEKNLNVGGTISIVGHATFDSIKIQDNVISTLAGTTELILDPFVDGLSNEGTVIIKGNLQVDGTTTSVNSSTVDINDAILVLGDVTSVRTVVTTVVAGVSTIRLDSVVGINTGDIISGNAGLNAGAANTVTAYDTSNKIITLTDPTISGIATTSQLTITHAFDTNTDRGIGFNYNTSSGTSNNKIGFFGLDDSSIADSTATVNNHGTHANDSRRWTYVPDATISNNLVSGTKGFLDVKGLYYQSGDFNTGGVVWFDNTGLQRSTNAVASPVITSKQILTAITKITLTLPSSITVATGDIIRQDTTGAFGVVETGSASPISSVDLIGVEDGAGGAFVNTQNIRREGQNGTITNLSVIPSTVTTIFTNKPHWTSTLDGGTF